MLICIKFVKVSFSEINFRFRPCDNPYLRACQMGDMKKVEETIDEKIGFKDANKWTG